MPLSSTVIINIGLVVFVPDPISHLDPIPNSFADSSSIVSIPSSLADPSLDPNSIPGPNSDPSLDLNPDPIIDPNPDPSLDPNPDPDTVPTSLKLLWAVSV